MKIIRDFISVLTVLILILVLILFQVVNTVDSTALSSEKFNRIFDDSRLSTALAATILDSANKSIPVSSGLGYLPGNVPGSDGSGGSSENPGYSADAAGFDYSAIIDRGWLESQLDITVKGIHNYLIKKDAVLPILDISPVWDNAEKYILGEVQKQEDLLKDLQIAKMVKSFLDSEIKGEFSKNKINDSLVNKFVTAAKNMDYEIETEAARIALYTYADNMGQPLEEVDKRIVAELVKSQTNFDKANTVIDLGYALEKITGSEKNPVYYLKEMVLNLKDNAIPYLILVIVAVILTLALVQFKLKPFLIWTGAGMILSGFAGVFIGLLNKIFQKLLYPLLNEVAAANEIGGGSSQRVQYILSCINGIFGYILIQGLIITLIGIIFFILGNLKFSDKRFSFSRRTSAVMLASRTSAVILIWLFISLNGIERFHKFYAIASEFDESAYKAEEYMYKNDMEKTVGDILGIEISEPR